MRTRASYFAPSIWVPGQNWISGASFSTVLDVHYFSRWFLYQVSTAMNESDDDTAPCCPKERTTIKRRRFTSQEKLCLLRTIRRRIDSEQQVSLRKACSDVNVHHKQYLNWTKQRTALEETKTKNFKAKSLCIGRVSVLKPLEQELTRFIFELREQGMGVSTSMVMLKATSLSRDFREKSRRAQYSSTRRFISSLGLVHRMATNESQKDPRETESESLDFLKSMHPKLTQPCRHQDFIINYASKADPALPTPRLHHQHGSDTGAIYLQF